MIAGISTFSADDASFTSKLNTQCAERIKACEITLNSAFSSLPVLSGFFQAGLMSNNFAHGIPNSVFVDDITRFGLLSVDSIYNVGYGTVMRREDLANFAAVFDAPLHINVTDEIVIPVVTAYLSAAVGSSLLSSPLTQGIVYQCLVGNCTSFEATDIVIGIGEFKGQNAVIGFSPLYVNSSFGFDGRHYLPSHCTARDVACFRQQLLNTNYSTPLVGLVYAVFLVQELFDDAVEELQPVALQLQFFEPGTSQVRFLMGMLHRSFLIAGVC